MPLSDQQIERYSRQILVTGGRAQERLLARRVAVAGTASAVELALRYLVGAGVRRLRLALAGADAATRDHLVAGLQALDAGVTITGDDDPADPPDLSLLVIDSPAMLTAAPTRRAAHQPAPLVAVRLDTPARIAIFPAASDRAAALSATAVFEPWAVAADEAGAKAGFVTLVAVTEVLKLLIEEAPAAEAVVIEFEGYATRIRRLVPDAAA